ncbi:Uncharacterised protein g2429 [Pycnogonum litorale]
MCAPSTLKESVLADATGYLDVNKQTLQHNRYKNVFGIGDCTSVPTPKTAAAVAAQLGILRKNLKAAMAGESLRSEVCMMIIENKRKSFLFSSMATNCGP